jgi:hypothetical protein
MGMCHEKDGSMEKAVQAYQNSLVYFPDYKPAIEALEKVPTGSRLT